MLAFAGMDLVLSYLFTGAVVGVVQWPYVELLADEAIRARNAAPQLRRPLLVVTFTLVVIFWLPAGLWYVYRRVGTLLARLHR